MNQWLFVEAAYAVALIGTMGVLLVSLIAMLQAESRVLALQGKADDEA